MSDAEIRLEGICLDPDEFFLNADSSSIHADVMESLRLEKDSQYVDPYTVKQNEDWSFLGSKIVGTELSEP